MFLTDLMYAPLMRMQGMKYWTRQRRFLYHLNSSNSMFSGRHWGMCPVWFPSYHNKNLACLSRLEPLTSMVYASAMGMASTRLMIQMMRMMTLVVDLLMCGLSGNMMAWYLQQFTVNNQTRPSKPSQPVHGDGSECEDTGINTQILKSSTSHSNPPKLLCRLYQDATFYCLF